MALEFVVEGAGCSSCAELVRGALSDLGTVESVEVDEAADLASVRLTSARVLSPDELDAVLGAAARDSGHEYRVRPGSLVEASPS